MSDKEKQQELTKEQKEKVEYIQKYFKDNTQDLIKEGEKVFIGAKTQLMRNKFFFYNIIKQFRPRMITEIPTVGVCWVKDRFHILFNPIFASHYTPEEYSHIFEHEVSHFVFDHMKHFKETKKERFKTPEEAERYVKEQKKQQIIKQLENIAMDRSINVYLKSLPNIRLYRYEVEGVGEVKQGNTDKGTADKGTADDKIVNIYKKGPIPELDIVEVRVITENSFKDTLKEGGYEGNLDSINKYDTWQYYYDLLLKCPKQKEMLDKVEQMDVHLEGTTQEGDGGEGKKDKLSVPGQSKGNEEGKDKFQKNEEGTDKPTQDDMDDVLSSAYRDTDDKSDIPGHLREQVEQAMQRQQSKPLPWNVLLKKHINKAKKTVREANINIRNIYYNKTRAILTAYKNKPLYKVGIIYDTSGSCSCPTIQGKFWNEVEGLRKEGAEITVYYTDAQVEHVQKIDPRKRITPDDYEGVGGGGTDLDVGIVKSIEDKNNIHIMLSDCYMHFNLGPSDLKGNKVICACNTDEKMPEYYGRTIRINEEDL